MTIRTKDGQIIPGSPTIAKLLAPREMLPKGLLRFRQGPFFKAPIKYSISFRAIFGTVIDCDRATAEFFWSHAAASLPDRKRWQVISNILFLVFVHTTFHLLIIHTRERENIHRYNWTRALWKLCNTYSGCLLMYLLQTI